MNPNRAHRLRSRDCRPPSVEAPMSSPRQHTHRQPPIRSRRRHQPCHSACVCDSSSLRLSACPPSRCESGKRHGDQLHTAAGGADAARRRGAIRAHAMLPTAPAGVRGVAGRPPRACGRARGGARAGDGCVVHDAMHGSTLLVVSVLGFEGIPLNLIAPCIPPLLQTWETSRWAHPRTRTACTCSRRSSWRVRCVHGLGLASNPRWIIKSLLESCER